jgi:hypothetical protein
LIDARASQTLAELTADGSFYARYIPLLADLSATRTSCGVDAC